MKSSKLNLQLSITAFLFMIAVMLFSCQKDNSAPAVPVSEEEAVTMSQENAEADAEYEDASEIAFSADADVNVSADVEIPGSPNDGGLSAGARVYANLEFKLGPCTKITVTPNDSTYPKTIVIDYGDGCICRDGKFRKGAIVLHYTKPIRRPGAVLTISFRNYFVNRVHIEGTKIIKNLTVGTTHKFSVEVNDGKVTFPGGRGFKYEKMKVVTQVRGMETRTVRDDVYSIEGRSKTTYANGTTVNLNTETPLIKPVECRWIVKGILKIKINDRVLFLDFGNGNCDNKATLKVGERTLDIILH